MDADLGGQPPERDRLQREPRGHEPARPEALREDAGERATIIVAPVQTSSLTPACSGEFPSTVWMNWLRKKIEPNIPKYIASDTALVTAKRRLAKNSIGSIGDRAQLVEHEADQSARRPPARR